MTQINDTKPVRRVLAAILTMLLLLSLMPVSAFASSETGSDNVCTISDGSRYTTLAEALAVVEDGQTITLLQNIPSAAGFMVSGKTIEINLNGNTLNISTSGQNGIEVQSGGTLTISGGGQLNVNVAGAASHGLYASGTLTVTSPCTVTSAYGIGVYAYSGDIFLQNASVTGHGIGASATYGSVYIVGDVAAIGGRGSHGVSAYSGGRVEITGSVSSGSIGVFADGANSKIIVKGDVTTNQSDSLGVYAYDTAEVTIDGVITAVKYIQVGTTTKTVDDKTYPTTNFGYHTYTDFTSTVWVKDTTPSTNECAIGSTEYATLATALAAVTDATPTTIKILKDIDHIGSVQLINHNITFDLNGHFVNLEATGVAETALIVNGGSLGLTGSGELAITGNANGIKVQNNGTATVTSTKVIGGSGGIAAAAEGNGILVVLDDAIATSYSDCAVLANFGGSVTVNGNVQSVWQAAFAGQPAISGGRKSTVYIKGNATATATSVGSAAVHAFAGGEITIDGTLTTDIPSRYILVGNTQKGIADITQPTTKSGYYTYTDNTSKVWVKDTTIPSNVCEIVGGSGYLALDTALAVATDSQTVRLLADINYTGGIELHNKSLTLELNGHTLDISNSPDDAVGLWVENGDLYLTGNGELNVTGGWVGVRVQGSGSEVTVTTACGGSVNVNSVGAYVSDNGKLTVTGSVTGSRYGAYSSSQGEIIVGGNAIATAPVPYDCFGAAADSGGVITISGTAQSSDRGIYAYNPNSKITVGNVVSSSTGINSHKIAVQVDNWAQVFILGDCTINAEYGTAVHVSSGGQATIDGTINHNGVYVKIYTTVKDGSPASRTLPTTKQGYHTYSTEEGTVWVKNSDALEVTGITVKTQPTHLTYNAGQTLNLSGLVVTLGYNNGSTLDVDYEDFSFMNITVNPAHGSVMSVAAHHNKPVALSYNGKTAYTDHLIVTAVPTGIPNPTPNSPPIYTPSSLAPTPSPAPIMDTVEIDRLDGSATVYIFEPSENGSIDVSVELPVELIQKNIVGKGATEEPFRLNIPITSGKLISIIKENEVQEVKLTVTVPDDILNNRYLATNIMLASELLKAATENGTDITVTVADGNKRVRYSWTFTGENLINSSKTLAEVNLFIEVGALDSDDKIKELLRKGSGTASGLIVNFGHEGILPAQASVRIYVGDQEFFDLGGRFYLYHYNTATGKLETLPYSSDYFVDKEGYATVDILHCSDYVMLPEKAGNDYITSLCDQISITPANSTLFVGGTTGTTAALFIELPTTLELVNNMEMKTSQSAIGAVTAAYRSSNEKVATVNDKGMITAIGIGTARITTKITLYSGKTKTMVTTITVKKPYISFSRITASMKVGEVFGFKVDCYGMKPDDVTWTTIRKSIVVINKKTGKAVATSKGIDYVVAKAGRVSKKIKVVVD